MSPTVFKAQFSSVHKKLKSILTVILILLPLTLLAEEGADIYTVQVVVVDNSEESRQAAIVDGLHQVVDELVAATLISPNSKVETLYAQANQYVESYSYSAESDVVSDLSSKFLILHFDAEALNHFFMQSGMMQSYQFDVNVLSITSEAAFQKMMTILQSIKGTQSVVVLQATLDHVIVRVSSFQHQSTWLELLGANSHFLTMNERPDGMLEIRLQ